MTSKLDKLANKVKTKPGQQSKSRARGKGNELESVRPTKTSSQLEHAAMEADVRQWVRHWAKCGWDAIEATAAMHPELKKTEIMRISQQYRTSPLLMDALQAIMREIKDRLELTMDEAAEILSNQATTSVIDFFQDDGRVLSVADMRRLPRHKQLALKKLKVTESERYDKDGNLLGSTVTTEVEAYDIQQAIERLARLRQWGFTETERDIAEMLKRAEQRLQQREPIDISDYDIPED
jgi:hypothetical protein